MDEYAEFLLVNDPGSMEGILCQNWWKYGRHSVSKLVFFDLRGTLGEKKLTL